MLRLYNYQPSGNCYKIRLLLHQLDIPFESIAVDILKGETRTAAFLALNPNGRVPLLELAPGRQLAESNAIIFYLAEETPFLPEDRWERAQVLQWLCFEQYSHEPNIATSRFIISYLKRADDFAQVLEKKRKDGYAALDVMEKHLGITRSFFVAEAYTIADIALFAYTHVAHEGGFDLSPYPAIRAWIARIEAEPRHISIGF